MINDIMKKPDRINPTKLPTKYMSGDEVLRTFYNQGWFKNKDYIPYELKEKNWKPDEKQEYLVWYHHTNPADPADCGEDVLDYIEVANFYMDFIKCEIRDKISTLKPYELLNLARYLKIENK